MPIHHLRSRIDDLSRRIEQSHDAMEMRRMAQECNELERAIQVNEDQLKREVAEMEAAKVQLHRLKARL
jgi:predicted  nucleic acid-binding Zn-ribbon protein